MGAHWVILNFPVATFLKSQKKQVNVILIIHFIITQALSLQHVINIKSYHWDLLHAVSCTKSLNSGVPLD